MKPIQPGDIVIVDHDTFTGEGVHGDRPCLVTRVAGDMISVRPKRYPTKAEIERGNFDPWVKSARRISTSEVIRHAHEQEITE